MSETLARAIDAENLGPIPGRGALRAQRLRKHRTAAQHIAPVISDGASRHGTLSEWLRRGPRNPLGPTRRGSHPLGVAFHIGGPRAHRQPSEAEKASSAQCEQHRQACHVHGQMQLLSVLHVLSPT